TPLGVQVCDQAGRVNCILPTPTGHVTSLCIGGENFDQLFPACGDKGYVRKLKGKSSPARAAPHKPPATRPWRQPFLEAAASTITTRAVEFVIGHNYYWDSPWGPRH